jgi:ribosome-interacting GTPase 1
MMRFEDVQVQLVDTPAVSAQHTEPWITNLVRNADGLLLVLAPAGDDLEGGIAAARAQLSRDHVVARGAKPTGDDHPFSVVRPVRVALNQSDLDPDGTLSALARELLDPAWPAHDISAVRGDGLEDLRRALWTGLDRIRIVAKEPGHKPDTERPFVLPNGATVADLARVVHKDVAERLKFARIWGHAAFDGQQVDRHHVLADRDVVELHA